MRSSSKNRKVYRGSRGGRYYKRRSKSGRWYRMYISKSKKRSKSKRSRRRQRSCEYGFNEPTYYHEFGELPQRRNNTQYYSHGFNEFNKPVYHEFGELPQKNSEEVYKPEIEPEIEPQIKPEIEPEIKPKIKLAPLEIEEEEEDEIKFEPISDKEKPISPILSEFLYDNDNLDDSNIRHHRNLMKIALIKEENQNVINFLLDKKIIKELLDGKVIQDIISNSNRLFSPFEKSRIILYSYNFKDIPFNIVYINKLTGELIQDTKNIDSRTRLHHKMLQSVCEKLGIEGNTYKKIMDLFHETFIAEAFYNDEDESYIIELILKNKDKNDIIDIIDLIEPVVNNYYENYENFDTLVNYTIL
jgi:hypothetical protein